VLLSSKVTAVDERGLTAETPAGPVRIDASNVIGAAGVRASTLGSTLGADLDRSGRVIVGDDLTIPGHSNVFVVGDLAHRLDPKTGELVPGIAQGALQMGRFAGRTMAAEIGARAKGRPLPRRCVFVYRDKGSMAIIGRNRAVAQLGRLRFGGPVALLAWALIHIRSLIGFRRKLILLTEWVWLYLFRSPGGPPDHR
jgi:NADH dehydrogenase